MPTKPRRRGLTPGLIVLALVVAVGAYAVSRRLPHVAANPGCEARSGRSVLSLDPQQAAIAATIAGVAHQQGMPAHAVQIAYAAALQESKLHNLHYGDRDSVGVFQQRPSEGWGSSRKLLDPVYASSRFFQVLATVPGYARMPVYQAAQAVQRSADGSAYMQYESMAARLATAFTGHSARAVWCWPGSSSSASTDLATAKRELLKTFGQIAASERASAGDAPTMVLRPARPTVGWAMAAWLVTHAAKYGIHEVRYGGYVWRASSGHAGWRKDRRPAPGSRVEAS